MPSYTVFFRVLYTVYILFYPYKNPPFTWGMHIQKQLSLKIQKLYSEQLSIAEADDAAGRLVSFFKILADIAKQQKQIKEV